MPKKGLIFLLLSAMLLLMLNNSFFRHIHVLPDGSLIEHAHPCSEFPGSSRENKHSHTETEILILNGIFHYYQLVIPVVLMLIASTGFMLNLNISQCHDIHHLRSVFYRLLRAPPVCR